LKQLDMVSRAACTAPKDRFLFILESFLDG